MTSSPGSMKAMNALSMPGGRVGQQGLSLSLNTPRLVQTLVGAGGDGDLGVGVQLPAPVRRIGLRDGLLQPGAALGGRVLVAVDPVEGLLGGVEDEVGRVVAKEALAHVDDGLLGRGGGGLIDDGPVLEFGWLVGWLVFVWSREQRRQRERARRGK